MSHDVLMKIFFIQSSNRTLRCHMSHDVIMKIFFIHLPTQYKYNNSKLLTFDLRVFSFRRLTTLPIKLTALAPSLEGQATLTIEDIRFCKICSIPIWTLPVLTCAYRVHRQQVCSSSDFLLRE